MLGSPERSCERWPIDNLETASFVEGVSSQAASRDEGSEPSEYDLPPNEQVFDRDTGVYEGYEAGIRQHAYHPKNAIDISASYEPPKNIFVTQLTQPTSSPSKIRGPRWRKKLPTPTPPSPEEGPAAAQVVQSIPVPQKGRSSDLRNEFEDDELALAAALSSPSSDEEVSNDPSPRHGPSENGRERISKSKATARLPSRSTASFHQTTLFGQLGSQGTRPASQEVSRSHSWPLASKVESPTHHRLDLNASKTWVYPTNLGSIRDYQYNIVQRGLFHNVLVALPTGLGKTFIAATIMLNWFRWTVDAQIVFMAPTKPLVSQQVEACFGVVGIPRSQTTMLTGNVQPAVRAGEWQGKRVFFMTPQTLIHDLKTGICDPKKLILLVVDEAHRATGNYAFVEVVRFLRRFNSSFRVLALTATPGASVEAVQNVIDALDIARVEIRTEESLDIREYVHSRNIDIELFENTEELAMSLDLFSRALQPVLDQLVGLNVYWLRDASSLTAYGLTKARQQWMGTEAARKASFPLKAKANAIFNVLASLAHAMELLKFHGIGSFYRNLLDFKNSTSDGTNNGKYPKQIANDEHFKKLLNRLQAWVNNPDFIGHPKLLYLKNVVLNHFMDAGEGRGTAGGRPPSDTRIMIFVHYRDSAEEVTRVLQRHGPMIRPHVFVGQTGSKGSHGMDQKTQLQVIEKFKKGIYNTIVATSIGEEGLDIGEIDLIICYDSSSSPVRMLQRMGRTGRKRAGNIVLLLMKGKEENSYIKAKDNYEKMQQMIASGSRFNFHDDRSPRIIPKDIIPVPDKRRVEIPMENSQLEPPEPRRRNKVAKRPPKKFHMPEGVDTGFVQASRIGGRNPTTSRPKFLDVDVAPLPVQASVLLSAKEEIELDQRYCNVGGSTPQYVHRPRLDAYPESQRRARRTDQVGHSRLTQRLVKCLDTIQRPLPNFAFCGDLIDLEKDIETPLRSRRHERPSFSTSEALAGSDSSHTTTAAKAPALENRWSSEARRGVVSWYGDDSLHAKGPSSSLSDRQTYDKHEEQPFYVSQQSNVNDDGSEDELPDVGNLVSRREVVSTTTHSVEDADPTTNTPGYQRKRRRVLVDESDDG